MGGAVPGAAGWWQGCSHPSQLCCVWHQEVLGEQHTGSRPRGMRPPEGTLHMWLTVPQKLSTEEVGYTGASRLCFQLHVCASGGAMPTLPT